MSPPLENFPHCCSKWRMLVLSRKLGQTHEKPSEWYVQLSQYSFFTRLVERQARSGVYNRKHLSSVKTKQASAHSRSFVVLWLKLIGRLLMMKESIGNGIVNVRNLLLRTPGGLQSVIPWSSACNPLHQLSLPWGRLPSLSLIDLLQIITLQLPFPWMNIELAMHRWMFQHVTW